MENELIENKNWLSRNFKWLLTLSLLLFTVGITTLITVNVEGNILDFIQAYEDNPLYENAVEKVKLNKRVKETLGEIETLDKLAILEGTTNYSNNNNSVETTIRIKGNKAKAKMDISAKRNGTEWEYKKINIRINGTKEEINILE